MMDRVWLKSWYIIQTYAQLGTDCTTINSNTGMETAIMYCTEVVMDSKWCTTFVM